METIRYTNPKKLGEIAFRYCMYPITCMILIEVFVMVTLLDHLSIKQFVLYAFPEVLSYIVIPVIILTFWYGGSRIISIEYKYDDKTLHLCHYNWIFRRKQRSIPLDDLNFCVYHIRAPFLFFKVTLIQLKNVRAKRTWVFASGLGWKRRQVDEIANKLKEIKEPTVYL